MITGMAGNVNRRFEKGKKRHNHPHEARNFIVNQVILTQNKRICLDKRIKTHMNSTQALFPMTEQEKNDTRAHIDSIYNCLLFSDIGQEVNRWI